MDKNTAFEELAFIKKVMQDSQKYFADNGKTYILWSGCVVLGLTIKFLKKLIQIDFSDAWIWLFLIIAGWLVSLFVQNKDAELQVRTFVQTALNGVWAGFAATVIILSLVSFAFKAIDSLVIPGIIAALLGNAHFTSGIITNEKIIKHSAFAWWAGSIIMFARPGEYAVPVLGLMIILFQMIPGILLYKKWQQIPRVARK